MPYHITNQQGDAMILTLNNQTPVNLPGHGNVTVQMPVHNIVYHNLTYALVGMWPFGQGEILTAYYTGGQNVNIQSQASGVNAVYRYQGP